MGRIGRSPLPPEEKARRLLERKEKRKVYKKRAYQPTLWIPIALKPGLDNLLKETGLSINTLFISAVEEKYGVTLHNKRDEDLV